MVSMRNLTFALLLTASAAFAQANRPNILFVISDDQSPMHVGAYGDTSNRTPAFDRIAREGALFHYAYAAAPACTPSRNALLTGRNPYEIEDGGVFWGILRSKFTFFTLLLEDAGYELGSTGKTRCPGWFEDGWKPKPFGKYHTRMLPEAQRRPGLDATDYALNFEEFLAQRDNDKPFFFWLGAWEPHRPWDVGAWKRAGKKLADARLPKFLPDAPEIRGEILDYGIEIEYFDNHLERALQALEQTGQLDNTLVIVTSDHGMAFPRAKATLYDSGTRVPLAVRLPGKIPGGREIDDFVSLIDVGPTLLEAAGLAARPEMSGRSFWPVLRSSKSGLVDASRDFAVTASERHVISRRGGAGYPMRAIRTHKYAYIRNYEPDRWPAGDPDFNAPYHDFFGDVDAGATKTWLMAHALDPAIRRYYLMAFGRRPGEELYDMEKDPDQLHNIAADPAMSEIKQHLIWKLNAYLQQTGDPRQRGATPWDDYSFYPAKRVLPPNYPNRDLLRNPNWKIEGMPTALPD